MTEPTCPTGTLEIRDLAVYHTTENITPTITAEMLTATGKLFNASTAGIRAHSYATPTIYGLNEAGKSVMVLSTGRLTPDWDTGPVSPADFVIKPGDSATFKISRLPPPRLDEVKKWYPTRPLIYWNDPANTAHCPGPYGPGDVVPASA